MNLDTQKRFEHLVKAAGVVSEETLAQAREFVTNLPLPSLLVVRYKADKTLMLQILAEVYRVKAIDLISEHPSRKLMKEISKGICVRTKAVPIRIEDGHVLVVFSDPEDLRSVDEMQAALGRPIRVSVALASDIDAFLNKESNISVHELVSDIVSESKKSVVRVSTNSEAFKPVARLVDRLLSEAITRKAMHMYLLPYPDGQVHVRICINRKVSELKPYATSMHQKVVNRLRILADLVGRDKRQPQSGNFVTMVGSNKHRFDVMIVPASDGEAVTIFVDQADQVKETQGSKKKGLCAGCNEDILEGWLFCPWCGKKL